MLQIPVVVLKIKALKSVPQAQKPSPEPVIRRPLHPTPNRLPRYYSLTGYYSKGTAMNLTVATSNPCENLAKLSPAACEWISHRGHSQDVQDLSWAPDGSALVSASVENLCLVWDLESGRARLRLEDHNHFVQGVAWDPLSRHIISQSADRTCRYGRHS